MEMLGGKDVAKMCRKPEIMSDAAYVILTRDKSFTGNFVIDEAILKEEGCKDFDQYAVEPGHELLPDGFIDGVDENAFSMVPGSSKAKGEQAAPSGGSSGGGGPAGGVSNVFKDVEGILNEDLVKKVNAVYAFDVQGKDEYIRLRRNHSDQLIFQGPTLVPGSLISRMEVVLLVVVIPARDLQMSHSH